MAPPITPQFITTRRVEFCETDLAGIVHFANFYKFMEQAEHDYFRSLGLSIMEKQADGTIIGWPRVSATCTFEAPAYYEDVLEARLCVSRKGVKSLTIEYEFWRGKTRIARGRMKTVCCHFVHGEPMRSIPIPPRYDEKILETPASDAPRGDE